MMEVLLLKLAKPGLLEVYYFLAQVLSRGARPAL